MAHRSPNPRAFPMRRALFPLALVWSLLTPGPGSAQDSGPDSEPRTCRSGRISDVFIDNHSIFNTAEMAEEVPFQWVYHAANRLHHRTRRSFLKSELLFGIGDCLDRLLLSESERLLRGYSFISEVDIYPLLQPDGTHHVIVDTQDEWTTKFDLRFDVDGGLRFRQIGLTEENLLGRGHLLGFFLTENDEDRDVGAELSSPRLWGTRMDGTIRAGSTRNGVFFEESLIYPFVGEVGRFALIESYARRQDLFGYATPKGFAYSNVLLPVETRRSELTVAIRSGVPGDLSVLGLGLARENRLYRGYPEGVLAVTNGNFGAGIPADSGVVNALNGQTQSGATTRLNVLVGKRQIRFLSRRGLDALRGEQDIRVGTQVLATVGRSLGRVFTSDDRERDEFWGRLSMFGGFATRVLVFNAELNMEGTRTFRTAQTPTAFNDILAEFDAYLYWQPDGSNHTVMGRVSASGGWNGTRPYQLTLGGRDGLRGYERDDFPGGQRMVFSLEDRILLNGPLSELVDAGLVLFVDGGEVWDGDVPFGEDSGLRASVGVGLRLGFPSGTRGVVRFDVASPVGADFGKIQFRLSMTELISLARGFEDPQMRRSRDVGPNPDIFGIQRVR